MLMRTHHATQQSPRTTLAAIGSFAELDKLTSDNKDKLVVVDYSTTWCGPCKMILPKFEKLAEQYSDAVFVKVIGDSTNDASQLMKREGVRSVPSFHFWKDGKKVEKVNGANEEALEQTLRDFH
ncbi:flagellar outer arm dynein 14 kDa light chain LC5 [Ectocarpus siliculosus]|uniref:Flagellar outer arm dynein 14 kDa light chain LC5 n=1 Tax=Ectocarpus siliculosus TaxID=2880 RepID=D7FM89_ECTSI|nr:flagellar outer arm dynein 14 kDa light chain LC5 [Ectocarpus siliculosus]|eukprot:CBJ29912.1 flagellar outer arm dynein 14 kDa light chain LC5 [Ectocarpus siliculosus]